MDTAHASIERGILNQALRLDNFFGNPKVCTLEQTRYELRWRNAIRLEHNGEGVKYGGSLRANLTLPKTSERLHLIFAGENEPEPITQSLPRDPGSPGFDRTTPATHFANTELRYDFIRNPKLNLFAGVGVRIRIPPQAFVRTRVEYTFDFSNFFQTRVAETFFVKSDDLLGETTEITLERLLAPGTVLRWASAGTASREIDGLEWGSELSLLHEISPKSAITLAGGVYGNTTASSLVSSYKVYTRYRRNFLRDWLFYEVEPEVNWQRGTSGSFTNIYALTLRLEIAFKGASAPTGEVTVGH